MTIANEDARTGPYNGNDSTTIFAYDFKILDQAYLVVTLTSAAGVDAVKTITTDYTVSGVGDEGGGNVTMLTAPATGEKLTISRAVPKTQLVDLQNRGAVQPAILESAYDKAIQITQDLGEAQNRTVKFTVSADLTSFDSTVPAPVASKIIGIKSDATGFELLDEPSTAVTAAQAAQAAAEAAQTAAETAETNAETAETNAAASEAAAAASAAAAAAAAAANLYNTISNVSGTVTPNLTTDDGTLYVCDTSSAQVTVNLSAIGTSEGIRYGFTNDSGTNNVVINANGSDTINGASSFTLSDDTEFVTIVADDASPDNWVTLSGSTIVAGSGLSKTGNTISIATGGVTVEMLEADAKPYDVAFNAGFGSDFTGSDLTVQTYSELVMTRSGSFTGEAGYLDTVATGAAVIIDIEKNGTTIYTTKPQFAVSTSTLTAGTLKTDGTEDFVSGDRITFKVTQIGSTIAGQKLRLTVKGEVT